MSLGQAKKMDFANFEGSFLNILTKIAVNFTVESFTISLIIQGESCESHFNFVSVLVGWERVTFSSATNTKDPQQTLRERSYITRSKYRQISLEKLEFQHFRLN